MACENMDFLSDEDFERLITPGFLFELSSRGQKDVLKWVMKLGLIASYYKCPVCGKNMSLNEEKTAFDGYEWRCCEQSGDKEHDIRRSVRAGSCFSPFNVNMTEILRLMLYWYLNYDLENVPYMFEIDMRTAADLFTFFREMCMIDLMKNSVQIGGKDVYIEVDVCELGRMEYGRHKLSAGKFVMGGVNKINNNNFFTVIDRNRREDFFNAIREWVLPGSVLISECWKSYNCYSDEEFMHLCTTRNLTFKNAVVSERDKSIAEARSSFEGPLKKDCENGVVFDMDLAEYIWRKQCNNTKSLRRFRTLLWTTIKSYQPLGRDKQS